MLSSPYRKPRTRSRRKWGTRGIAPSLASTRVQKRNDPQLKRWWKPHTLPWLCSVHGGGLCDEKHLQPGLQPDSIPHPPCRFRRRFSLGPRQASRSGVPGPIVPGKRAVNAAGVPRGRGRDAGEPSPAAPRHDAGGSAGPGNRHAPDDRGRRSVAGHAGAARRATTVRRCVTGQGASGSAA